MVTYEDMKNINEIDRLTHETNELKKKVEKENNPWKVVYIGESQDKKYKIYKYVVAQWWTRWWIKDKYINQIWPRVEWTQFSDEWWHTINKDRFNAWEIVYLRVPKKNNEKNENQKNRWKIEYICNKKDNKNKNWKRYSYTFVQWGTIEWVDSKRIDKFWNKIHDHIHRYYIDKYWNKLKKTRFNKWETIYIREPNIDLIDPTPDMTINEIMAISDNDLKNILFNELCKDNNYEYSNKHRDKLWEYIIINKKKVYILNSLGTQNNGNLSSTKACIDWSNHEETHINIIKKVWNNYRWIGWDKGDEKVYRWNFKRWISEYDNRVWFYHD